MAIEENNMLKLLFFCSSFLIVCYLCECLLPFLKKKTKIKVKLYPHHLFYKIIFICCLLLQVYIIIFGRELYSSEYFIYAVCSGCLNILFRQLSTNRKNFLSKLFYSKAEINLCLEDSESIGALWAHQTFDAYYKTTLENITDRMTAFEEKYNIRFSIHKLLIVIPLSCNIEGIFTEKDPLIREFGNLEIVEDDAGGNINRQFKNPVYRICSAQGRFQDDYIVAEYSQPVSTLSRSRFLLEKEKFIYIRECYIKTLNFLLQGRPCILVIHDDEKNTSENLSSSILSAIQTERNGADFIV